MSARLGRREEFLPNLRDDGALLLVQRPPQHVRPARRQAGKRFADLQNVFLIDDQPERVAQHGFQRWVRIRHGFESLIPPCEREFLAFVSRARPGDAHDGDERVDVANVALAAQTVHGRAFDMMHRPRAAAGNHFPNLRILPRLQRVQVHGEAALGQGCFHVAHHGQSALREHVHFHQADDLHGVHIEMRRGIALVGDERRGQFVHRLAREHHAARVHFRMTRKTVEKFRHVERGLEWFLIQRQVAVFGTGGEQFAQFRATTWGGFVRHPAAAEAPGKMSGEPAHIALGHAQHLRHIRERAAALKRRESAHHGALVATVFGEDQIHHVVFAVVREIYVNVRQFVQRHPFLIQKAAKVEAEANRANVGDAEAITNQRVGGAAARDPFNAVGATFLQEAPHDQEILFVANGADDAQFLLHLRAHGRGARAVAPAQPIQHELVKKRARRGTVGRRERGKLRRAKRDLKMAPLGDFQRLREPVGMFLARLGHFCGRAEMKPPIHALFWMCLAEQRQRADGLHDVEFLPVIGRRVVDCRTSHDAKPARDGLLRGQLVEPTGKLFG